MSARCLPPAPKPMPPHLGGWDGLRQVRAMTALPLVAIGGIHSHNAAAVLQAGADGLAMVSAICSAPDPCTASQTFKRQLDDHFKHFAH